MRGDTLVNDTPGDVSLARNLGVAECKSAFHQPTRALLGRIDVESGICGTHNGDAEEFCRWRKQVIEDFYEEFNVNQLQIYEQDPDPEEAKYKALTDDIRKVEESRQLLNVPKVDKIQSDHE